MMNKQEQILVRITGQDRPGLTASIMGILAKYDAQTAWTRPIQDR